MSFRTIPAAIKTANPHVYKLKLKKKNTIYLSAFKSQGKGTQPIIGPNFKLTALCFPEILFHRL